jgi:hypothetical protein
MKRRERRARAPQAEGRELSPRPLRSRHGDGCMQGRVQDVSPACLLVNRDWRHKRLTAMIRSPSSVPSHRHLQEDRTDAAFSAETNTLVS